MKLNGLYVMLSALLLVALVSGVAAVSLAASPDATLVADDGAGIDNDDGGNVRPQGWQDVSHSNDAAPNYAVVFPQDRVNRMTITIDPADWEAMQANMVELYGERGARGGRRGPGGGGSRPAAEGEMVAPGMPPDGQMPEGFGPPPGGAPPEGGALPPGFPADGEMPEGFGPPPGGAPPEGFGPSAGAARQGGTVPVTGTMQLGRERPAGGPAVGGGPFGGSRKPMWVPATIDFGGETWTKVGVRYKGNSSLMSLWGSDSLKLPLKLDFDEFEDDYPAIKNQRFYGFKQLSLSPNWGDASWMREVLAYELLAAAGLPAAQTAYYDVVLDYGAGAVDLGVYTVIEVIDDTVIARVFGDDSGNIYEAEGSAASLAAGTLARIADSFQKENNATEADWSDIEALYAALHAEDRTTAPAAWRARLESLFDVDGFLKWLAVSAVLQHWDTYGGMPHNFYLYHAEDGKLYWISWDHNHVLGGMGGAGGPGGPLDGARMDRPDGNVAVPAGQGAGPAGADEEAPVPAEQPTAENRRDRGRGGPGGRGGSALDKADVDENWPLIRYLLDDPVYHTRYVDSLTEVAELFDPTQLTARCETLAALLEPYAAGDDGGEAFRSAVDALLARIDVRAAEVAEFMVAQETQ